MRHKNSFQQTPLYGDAFNLVNQVVDQIFKDGNLISPNLHGWQAESCRTVGLSWMACLHDNRYTGKH